VNSQPLIPLRNIALEAPMSGMTERVTHVDRRPLIDQVAADWGNALWLLGRVLIAAIFIQSGFGKLTDLGGFAAMLANAGVPMSSVLAPIAPVVELGGGLAILLGLGTRYAALALIVFVAAATLISHRFWTYPPEQQQGQMVHFAKNIAIIGGFLFVFVTGGGHYSLERWLRRHQR
jgi:putative oxidoreductase